MLDDVDYIASHQNLLSIIVHLPHHDTNGNLAFPFVFQFRRLILIAMISRTIAIPIQIYSDPLWLQLISDTFPVMAFATA
jgi:hypothetical protein